MLCHESVWLCCVVLTQHIVCVRESVLCSLSLWVHINTVVAPLEWTVDMHVVDRGVHLVLFVGSAR